MGLIKYFAYFRSVTNMQPAKHSGEASSLELSLTSF